MGLQGGGRASLRCSCCTMMAAAFSSARSRALRSTRSCSCSSEAVACHATVTPPSRVRGWAHRVRGRPPGRLHPLRPYCCAPSPGLARAWGGTSCGGGAREMSGVRNASVASRWIASPGIASPCESSPARPPRGRSPDPPRGCPSWLGLGLEG